MAALHRDPGLALAGPLVGRVVRVIADGRGVDEQLGPGQGHEPGSLRVPLVPADEHPEPTHPGVDGREAEVPRGEVEFLVIARVVRDVHLAVDAGQAAVRVEHGRGVVVEAGRAPLEQRGDEDHAQFAGKSGKGFGARAGNGFGQVEAAGILGLAEVRGGVQFLEHDQVGAAGRGRAHARYAAVDVLVPVRGAAMLHQACLDDSHTRVPRGSCMVRQWSEPC